MELHTTARQPSHDSYGMATQTVATGVGKDVASAGRSPVLGSQLLPLPLS